MILQIHKCDPLQEALSHDCHVTIWLMSLYSRNRVLLLNRYDRFDTFPAKSNVFLNAQCLI